MSYCRLEDGKRGSNWSYLAPGSSTPHPPAGVPNGVGRQPHPICPAKCALPVGVPDRSSWRPYLPARLLCLALLVVSAGWQCHLGRVNCCCGGCQEAQFSCRTILALPCTWGWQDWLHAPWPGLPLGQGTRHGLDKIPWWAVFGLQVVFCLPCSSCWVLSASVLPPLLSWGWNKHPHNYFTSLPLQRRGWPWCKDSAVKAKIHAVVGLWHKIILIWSF